MTAGPIDGLDNNTRVTYSQLAEYVPNGYTAVGILGVYFTSDAQLKAFSIRNGAYSITYTNASSTAKVLAELLCKKS